MSDKKKKQVLDGVEELETDTVSCKEDRQNRKNRERGQYDALKNFTNTQKKYLVIGLFILAVIIATFVSILSLAGFNAEPQVWGKRVPLVLFVIVIQVGIGTLLDQNPIWLHACVFVADVIIGILIRNILSGSVPFMIYMGIIYITWVVSMEALQRLVKTNFKNRFRHAKH